MITGLLDKTHLDSRAKDTVGILGAGQWGTVLSLLAARAGRSVVLYDRNPDRAREMDDKRENTRFLPGYRLPPSVTVTADLSQVMEKCSLLIIATPARFFRESIQPLVPFHPRKKIIVHGTKGLEPESHKRMSQILAEVLRCNKTGVLSGPNLAYELAQGLPGASVIASRSRRVVQSVQVALTSDRFRVYGNRDVLGVELCGAFKNILAIGAGIADELKLGENTLAMLVTRGVAELHRLTRSLGGKQQTILGLAGIGDILATCTSPLSRNFRAGQLLAQGNSVDAVYSKIGSTVEGLSTISLAMDLAAQRKIQLPITSALSMVCERKTSIQEALHSLMQRPMAYEFEKERP